MSEGAVPGYLLPRTASLDARGVLSIGGVSVSRLAERFQTPLFIYDETQIRQLMREIRSVFPGNVVYASKAFGAVAMARIVSEEGLWWDAASEGELAAALRGKIPAKKVVLHGNNKSPRELATALEVGVGRIVVDSFDEIDRLLALCDRERVPKVWVRVTPGIEAHTHEYIRTGQQDSKFGFNLANGDASRAIRILKRAGKVELAGVHCHIGSQIFETGFFKEAIEVMADLLHGEELGDLCMGGGLGVAYINGESAPSVGEWGTFIAEQAAGRGIDAANLYVEPGRSLVAAAAVTLYTVGAVKAIPGIRTYVAVDGGMSDNPRPVLYGSGYEAFLPERAFDPHDTAMTVVGKHCESGDILVRDALLPANLRSGELLVTPVTGAYGYSMGSNYNRLPRPAVVFVKDGSAREVIRRESVADLFRLEMG